MSSNIMESSDMPNIDGLDQWPAQNMHDSGISDIYTYLNSPSKYSESEPASDYVGFHASLS